MASIFDIQPLAYIGSRDDYKEITKTDMWNRYVDTVFENARYKNDDLKEFLYESAESSIFEIHDFYNDIFTEGFGSNLAINLKAFINKVKNAIINMINKFKTSVQSAITRGSLKKTINDIHKFIIEYPDLAFEKVQVRDLELLYDAFNASIKDASYNRKECDKIYDEFSHKCDKWYRTYSNDKYLELKTIENGLLTDISAAVKCAETNKKRAIIELDKISREYHSDGDIEKYQTDINYVNFVAKTINLFLKYALMEFKDINTRLTLLKKKSTFYDPSKIVNDDLEWKDIYSEPFIINKVSYNLNKQMSDLDDRMNTITEGANIDVHNKMKEAKKGYKESMKKIKSLIKNEEYSDAHKEVRKAIKFLKTMKNETKNIMKNEETSDFTALKGLILQSIIETAKILIVTIVTAGLGTILATAMISIKDITNYLSNLQSKKGDISAEDYNIYYVNIMKLYDKQIKTLKIMDDKISDVENGKINLSKSEKDKVINNNDNKTNDYNIKESTYDIITEAYKGKTPNLLKAEDALSKLIDSMKNDSLKDYTNSPDNKSLENALCNQFGFKSVNISWKRFPSAMSNVYTMFNVNVLFGNSPGFVDSKTGYYDKNHKHVLYIVADSNAVKNLGWSAQEYLAVLLHEIGHNFDSSPYMLIHLSMLTISQLTSIMLDIIENKNVPVTLLPTIKQIASTTNSGRTIISSITAFIEKIKDQFPVLKKFMNGVKIIGSTLSRWAEKGISPLLILSTVPAYVLFSPLLQLSSAFMRKNEQHADSFAVYYGYGDSLASALSRLETMNLNVDKVHSPINKVLTDLALANRTIINGLCGIHGSQDTRIMDTILLIENEIKRGDYPPEVVAELKDQLENTKLTYSIFMKGGENKFVVTAFVRETLANLFNGRTDYIAKLFPSYSYLDVKEYTDDLPDEDVDELAEENSASINGSMLPQGDLTGSTSSDDELNKEIDELTKIVDEACGGPYIYSSELLCESELFQDTVNSITDKFKSIGKVTEDKIRNNKTLKVCKIQSSIVSNQIRMRIEVAKDSKKGKESKIYKKALVNTIKLEKDLRKQVEQLTAAEKAFFNNFKKELNQKSKPIEKKLIDEAKKIANTGKKVGIKTESYKGLLSTIADCYLEESTYEEEIYNEAANIDPEIKSQIDKLNKKGYVTKYSSPGHDNVRIKRDSNGDGAYYGKLYNDARIMFADKYDFPEAPEGWFWRQVDGKSYLDIKPKSYNKDMGNRDEVYKKWKDEYMNALDEWIDKLPDNTEKKSDDESSDNDSENTTVKEFADNFLFDLAILSGVDVL